MSHFYCSYYWLLLLLLLLLSFTTVVRSRVALIVVSGPKIMVVWRIFCNWQFVLNYGLDIVVASELVDTFCSPRPDNCRPQFAL